MKKMYFNNAVAMFLVLLVMVVFNSSCSRHFDTACPTFKPLNEAAPKQTASKISKHKKANRAEQNSATAAIQPTAQEKVAAFETLNTLPAYNLTASANEDLALLVSEVNVPVVAATAAPQTVEAPASATMSKQEQKLLKKIEKATQDGKVSVLEAASISQAAKKVQNPEKQTPAAPTSGKSQLIALVLAALVGVLGIHRFYLGYTLEGVLQLLTAGGCGIWALIDLIRIITGDLQPKNGSYTETL